MILHSRINPAAESFRENDRELRGLAERLRETVAVVLRGGSEAALARHRARGKMTARERIDELLDSGSPFLEIGQLAAHEVYDSPLPAAGIVCGAGWICGRPCVVVANDATVKGGAYYPLTVKKHLRAQEIAAACRLPCVYLADSGGAFLKGQAEVFPDRDHFGRIFRNQAKMSADGIPQIAAVMGPCTAGGAYIPAMSDEAVIVKGSGAIYLAGPPLVKAATGETIDSESLGGADVHARVSGVADHYAENDREALRTVRRIISHLGDGSDANSDSDSNLNSNSNSALPVFSDAPPPRFSPDELHGVVGANLRRAFDMREVVARVADDSDFDEFKARHAGTLLTGFARIGGIPVAILANNGALFSESALKGAHFIDLANRRGVALLFLQNITGFMVGEKHERGGIAKHGAKMVNAVACASVPKIVVIVGGSYGAGNYAMCGRAFDPDFLFAWPSARVAVMGGEQAAGVLREIAAARGAKKRETESVARETLRQFERESDPYYGSARLWDDGVIDPAQTREVLKLALAASAAKPRGPARYGVFRM